LGDVLMVLSLCWQANASPTVGVGSEALLGIGL
jgi:hypothetical protein